MLSKIPVAVEIAGLPPFLYVGESTAITVKLRNGDPSARSISVNFTVGESLAASRSVALASDEERCIILELCPHDSPTPIQAEIEAVCDGAPFFVKPFVLRNGREHLGDISTDGHGFQTADGTAAVLVNRYEDQAQHRSFVPLKALFRDRAAARAWLSISMNQHSDSNAAPAAELLARSLPNTSCKQIANDGDPLKAVLLIDQQVPKTGTILFAWGFDEAFRRLPKRDLARALDLAIDRTRKLNPSLTIVVATPPPIFEEESISELYAAEIRSIAEAHHLHCIDLHASMLNEANWQSLYSADGTPDCTSLYPNAKGQARLMTWLAEGLQ